MAQLPRYFVRFVSEGKKEPLCIVLSEQGEKLLLLPYENTKFFVETSVMEWYVTTCVSEMHVCMTITYVSTQNGGGWGPQAPGVNTLDLIYAMWGK